MSNTKNQPEGAQSTGNGNVDSGMNSSEFNPAQHPDFDHTAHQHATFTEIGGRCEGVVDGSSDAATMI